MEKVVLESERWRLRVHLLPLPCQLFLYGGRLLKHIVTKRPVSIEDNNS